jgi:acyl-coenzyme A synthetase/AMP-(fatty) acid ligase
VPTESLLARFAAEAHCRPDSAALRWNGREISYRELHDMARATAERLRENGVPGGNAVCVTGRKSPEMVATLLACFMSGHRVLLPANDLGEQTLLRLCEQADCDYLVRVGPGREPGGLEFHRLRPQAGGVRPGRQPAGPGLMLTTSGSTGLPKIVPLSADGVDSFLGWAGEQFEIGAGSVVLNFAPLNFDLCLLDVWTSLARGACVLLVDEDAATKGDHLLGLVATATVVQAVPMLFRLVTDAARGTALPCDGVRQVIFTGDVMPPEVLGDAKGLFRRAALYNLYGCTETNDSFLHRVDGTAPDDGPLPIGRPIPGVTAAVIGADGALLGGAGIGELLVRTPFQAAGYLDARLDEGRFGPPPAGLPQGRYYRTGDLVRRDDAGVLTLIGRADFHVKVRGVRVNTQEVEAVIAAHEEVIEAAVVALPDRLAGHRLHAVVRRTPDATLDGLQLRRHCAARLARTAIPGRVEISDEPLPRTSTGKLDRHQVRITRFGGN